ncbi:uncharacterized protein LOC130449051 [Diorhabda sublineata]|uniref:uncharacterized protein LOC130449051 n=1 Tax=Diorhabda sublineata TaxID=1163346 RepID=UPI0024E14E49|nr:uncharacterized protein LOC130449051 [Diorhabda sublineata]
MLTLRARNTLIKDALREILNSTKYESRDVVKYTYTEKNYFEAANQEYWGTVKRPKYVYDKKVVRQLQNFYKQIRCPEDEVFWNYSVEHLRRIARKRDVMDFIEKLYKKCEKGQRRARYLHDMYSASNVGVEDIQKNEQLESSSSPYSSIGNQMLINKSQSQVVPKLETNYETLNKLLEKLERSVMIKNTDREKFATAYFILRYYFLKIADELSGDSASFLSLLNLKAPTKIEETPERMLFEKFDPIWVERKRRLPPIDVGGLPLSKPKPKVLEGVPLDKPQLVYDRYFKKSAPAKGKKEKTEKENIQKDKKKKNKDAVTKSLVNVVNGNFDPFADFVVPVNSQTMEKDKSSVSQATVSSGSIKIPQSTTLSYYDKYLIVYTNLAAAVDSMVSALETMKDNTIDTQILSELTNCNIVNLITDYNRCSVSTEKSEEDKDTNLREPDEYFEYLMKTHLTDNINIQDYFINGETLPIVADITEETDTIIKPIESFHLFQLTDGQSDTSADVKSGEMQTSINYDDDFKPFSNILIEDELLSERVQSEQEANQSEHEEEEVSSEIFYYIENGL